MTRFELDDLYLSMIQHGGARMPDDLADLRAEFPAWRFDTYWQTVGSGPDARWLMAWRGDVAGSTVTAPDADQMRRKIRETTK